MEKKDTILMHRYALGKLLGHGNFAKVYYGRDIRSGQSVAIKVIDKEKVFHDGLINPINREVSIMRRLQHPNIVQLYDVIESETKTYLVMEYLGGGELFDKVARGKLEEGVARKYFQQLICAIHYCHSRGVYHRDIKPENLLLDESGNLKITDFGLSALFETRRQDGLLHTTCGTPSYMSPEVINRKGYDGAKADIWSCGVVLFILLAGYHPFQDPSNIEQQRKITRGDFRFPTWFNTQVRMLLVSIPVPDPDRRVSVDTIMELSWFKKGYKPRFHGFNVSEKNQGHEADSRFTITKTLAGIVSKLDKAIKSKKKDAYVKLQCYKGARPVLTY